MFILTATFAKSRSYYFPP